MSKAVYLLTGESFLADEALAKIRAETATDPLSETTFDPSTSAAEILGALETRSLLGGRRLVIIRDAQSLRKDVTDALDSYLQSPSPDSVLVLIADGRTKLQASAKQAGAVVNLELPKGRRLVSWLRDRARGLKLKLDDRAAWALIDAVGNELRDLTRALDQLATGLGQGAQVSVKDVHRAFPRLSDERTYVLTDAVGERRLPQAMGTLRRLLEQGDEPLMLFGALTAHVRRMLVARPHAEQGPRALGEALGMPEWRAKKLHAQVRSYREDELVRALGILARTDAEMKGGDLPPEMALERAVLEIVSGPPA